MFSLTDSKTKIFSEPWTECVEDLFLEKKRNFLIDVSDYLSELELETDLDLSDLDIHTKNLENCCHNLDKVIYQVVNGMRFFENVGLDDQENKENLRDLNQIRLDLVNLSGRIPEIIKDESRIRRLISSCSKDTSPPNVLLFYAVDHENSALTKALLEQGADPLFRQGKDLRTPLHLAVIKDDLLSLNYLGSKVAAGLYPLGCIDEILEDRKGQTPLHLLCQSSGDFKNQMFRYLTDRLKMDVTYQDKIGNTPLSIIANRGDADFLIEVLKKFPKGSKIDIQDSHGDTWLHHICRVMNKFSEKLFFELIDLYKEKGGDLNLRNKQGKTAANFVEGCCRFWTPRYNSFAYPVPDSLEKSVVRIFLKEKFLSNVIKALSEPVITPLEKNHKSPSLLLSPLDEVSIEEALKKGANPNQKNFTFQSPIEQVLEDTSIEEEKKHSIIHLLIVNGTSVSEDFLLGLPKGSPLFQVIKRATEDPKFVAYSDLIEELIGTSSLFLETALGVLPKKAYPNIHILDFYLAPLHFAIHTKNQALLKLALEAGSNPNLVFGPLQKTPLQLASLTGDSAFIEMLVEYGADPSQI